MVLIHESLPEGGLLLQWHVNAAIYSRETAQAWFQALVASARWLAENPEHAERDLPDLLPDEERRLAAWEHGPAIARPKLRFHELFETVVDRPGQAERPGPW